jgi:hypothetical protein
MHGAMEILYLLFKGMSPFIAQFVLAKNKKASGYNIRLTGNNLLLST